MRRLNKIKTDEGELSPQTIKRIKKSLEDIKAGRTYSTEEVKKKLGIKS
jgi:predicted transcriptional regulator